METKGIITMAVTVTVALIVLGVVLIPVLDDTTPSTKTYNNVGIPFALADAEDTDTHIIVVDSTGVTSDGETIDSSPYLGTNDYTLVFGEHSILRYAPITGRVVLGGTVSDGSAQQFTDLRSASSSETLTLTIVGDTLTSVNGETTKTIEDNWAYVSASGDYRYLTNPCVTASDRVIGGGVTYSPFSSATVICFDGTIDGITAGIYRSTPTATLNSVDVVTSSITTNLVKIDAIKFNCTQNGNDVTATYTYFLAPAEITYENPYYVGDQSAALLAAVPVLIIIAILLGVAAVVLRNRMG